MQTLTPEIIELVGYAEDGEQARHYQFRLLKPQPAWQQLLAGQFFMLTVPGAGEAPFTFTLRPDANGEFSALVRRMGAVTKALFDLPIGALLGARGPYGRPWPVSELKNQRILIVAGGCGLAPLSCLIDQLLEAKEYQQLALIYGARSKAAQMLTVKRAAWSQQCQLTDVVEQADGQGAAGTPLDVLPQVLARFGDAPTRLLLCGPEIMMTVMAAAFEQRGLPASAIWLSVERKMHCAIGSCGHCYLGHQYVCKQGPTFCWEELRQLLGACKLPAIESHSDYG